VISLLKLQICDKQSVPVTHPPTPITQSVEE
jgi:hypothetical protein